jgi:sulfoxide reductase heme-binding subunit YedZ
VVFPAWAPQQPTIDLLGALALYCLGFVLLTSHYRVVLGRRTWKTLHFTTYFLAGFVFVHSLLTDPRLNDSRVDYLDAGKLFVEACLLIVVVAVILRARHGVRKARRVPFPAESITEGTL